MKEYEFETYSRGLLFLTVIVWVVISVSIIALTAKLLNTDLGEILFFVFVGVWILILYLFLRYVLRKNAKLTLKGNQIIVNTGNAVKEIKISDIQSYKYRLGRDSKLTFYLRDGFDISLYSNDMFCQNEQLELFCKDFDLHLETIPDEAKNHNTDRISQKIEYETSISPNNSDIKSTKEAVPADNDKSNNDELKRTGKPKKLLSFYDKKWALPVLIISSIVGFGFPIYVYFDGGTISGVFIAGIGGLMAMWGAYYKHKEK